MPALTTKKRPACSPADLAADIARIQDEIVAYVDKRAAEVKLSCPGLPLEVIRRDLVKFECPCRAALRLINE